jgi:predicted DCC family thiol-disulfide oxidoreductase YuxK
MPLVLFDGVCNLCNGIVRFIVTRDRNARFKFAALESAAAARVLESASVTGPLPDSLLLIDDGRVFSRSDAALRIARGLGFPWQLAYGLIAVPRPLRDRLYDLVARHRYRLFGRRETCMVPSASIRKRFLA